MLKTIFTLTSLFVLSLNAFAAGVTGTWKMSAQAPDGNTHKFDLVLKESGGKYDGSLVGEQGTLPLQDVAVTNDDVAFKITMDFGQIAFKLKQDGDAMKGNLTLPDGGTGPVTGTRDGASAAPAAATTTSSSATGKWKVVAKDSEGNETRSTLDLKQDGAKLTGVILLESGDEAPISDGTVDGAEFAFKIPTGDGAFMVKGKVDGATVKGTYQTPNGTKGEFNGSK
ncbi:hypothetical protein [uncultured Paludibaculum sp.]|uniref:hypothetical protein n=1 Tax=uncultured Paludibaculum sp. TaxID=1765020 RepID=UPI002AAA63CA|nr:hypothetical protein [uncultured Paludibaculum sp.]